MNIIARLNWTDVSVLSGLERGVFYPSEGSGVPWDGLVEISEVPTEAVSHAVYLDGSKKQDRRSQEHFSGKIKAYSYPDQFYSDILVQRRPKTFGLSWRVDQGDTYELHLVYNALISPQSYIHQQSDFETFDWNFTTLPIPIESQLSNASRTSHLIVETSVAYSWTIEALENVLYGTDSETSRLPSPNEVFQIFEENSILIVVDNGDGTFTVTGPDEAIVMLDSITFEITWPSAVYITADRYRISSL